MAREFQRTDRVSQEIQRELAILLQREVKDPRLPMTTISDVRVSKDLMTANIYVTFLGRDTPELVEESIAMLNSMHGFLRSMLSQRLRLRALPRLHFHYDPSLVRGRQLSSLIDKAVAADKARGDDFAPVAPDAQNDTRDDE